MLVKAKRSTFFEVTSFWIEDNELAYIGGYPGNVWVTENTAWAVRVGAVEKTKIEAQTLVNLAISGSLIDENGLPTTGSDGTQIVINLP